MMKKLNCMSLNMLEGNRLRIPIRVDEDDELRKNQIPNKGYHGKILCVKGTKNTLKVYGIREYEYDKAPYVEIAKTIDDLVSKLKKYGCYVF